MKQTRFGWVDLSNLPTTDNGTIKWKEAIGRTIPFKYNEIESFMVIKAKLESQYVLIDVPGYVTDFRIYVGQIKNGKIGNCLYPQRLAFMYKIGDVVNDIEILDCFYRYDNAKQNKSSRHRYYHCKCKIDGYEWDLREEHLCQGVRCPVCANKITVVGINDIATIAPEYIRYFANPEDATKHCLYSNKSVDFQCPDCGALYHRVVKYVTSNGFVCQRCGDGVSYPNKFISNVLMQLARRNPNDAGLNSFKRECDFPWSQSVPVSWKTDGKKMIYDVYIPHHNIIVENHGEQHYRDARGVFGGDMSLAMQQENDAKKMDIAITHGIERDRYVVLDCRRSKPNFIRESVMSSALPSILHFDEQDIDWHECDIFASKSFLVEVCKLHATGLQCNEIAKRLCIHPQTVQKYIINGRKLGLVA